MMNLEVVQCGLIDGQTHMMNLDFAFRISPNAPKNKS